MFVHFYALKVSSKSPYLYTVVYKWLRIIEPLKQHLSGGHGNLVWKEMPKVLIELLDKMVEIFTCGNFSRRPADWMYSHPTTLKSLSSSSLTPCLLDGVFSSLSSGITRFSNPINILPYSFGASIFTYKFTFLIDRFCNKINIHYYNIYKNFSKNPPFYFKRDLNVLRTRMRKDKEGGG